MLMTTPSWQRPAAATSAPTQPLQQAPSRTCRPIKYSRCVELRLRSWRGRHCSWRQRAGFGPSSLLLDCTCLSFGAELEHGWQDCSSAATRATPAPHRVPAPQRSFSVLGECSERVAGLPRRYSPWRPVQDAARGARSGSLARARRAAPCLPNIHPNPNPFRELRSLARWSLGSTLARSRPLRAAPRTARPLRPTIVF